jgi:aspartyl-tRNA(Asn)/glutamyl-tRNA(Gln) amidotransferase subunit B
MPENVTYEGVIGLEVHVQLSTRTKAFSRDPNEFVLEPNRHVSSVSLGHPGTLPRLNEKVIGYAVLLGLACGSDIAGSVTFSRKNYFYTDLPKGYQISQYENPVCSGGSVPIPVEGGLKKIRLVRIHIEEDAGKSIHDQDPANTLIDLNRAGVPLLEVVSEPDIRSSEEACRFLLEIRKLVRYLEISDGNMEQGSLRCDANVSVRPMGESKLGIRTEIKNLNSFSNLRKAIDHEIERQIKEVKAGKTIVQQTLGYNEKSNLTFPLRDKEEADDYRYFPEPDLVPFKITGTFINAIKASLPSLPQELKEKFIAQFGLSAYDAEVITEDKNLALLFENITRNTTNFKAAANWIIGPVKTWLNEHAADASGFPVSAGKISGLIALVDEGRINYSLAAKKVFPLMLEHPEKDPGQIISEHALVQESDTSEILKWINQAFDKYPDKIREYNQGKKGLIGLFMGEVMRLSQGKSDPEATRDLINRELNKRKEK